MSPFYDLFESLFDYTQGFYDFVDLVNIYDPIGLWMIGVVIVVWLFYYIVIDHARLNKWYWWLLFGLLACGICFGISYGLTDTAVFDYYVNNGMQTPAMGESYFLLAITVSIYAFALYMILSAIFKRWCHNCRHTPWKSIWPKH